MDNYNKLYWVWLAQRMGTESKDFPALATRFDDPYQIYRMESEEIERLERLRANSKDKLCDKSLEDAYKIIKYCNASEIDIITYNDPKYPARLKAIQAPPIVLYCQGELPDMDSCVCIGIVGTRKISEYGSKIAYKISYELGAANVCVVSGMALGVDGVAACGVMEAGGKTVAVLGCGLSITYPKEHARLRRAIAKNGAVISEFPPGEGPKQYNFPKRNRIISGLCQGVLIIEGSKGSGSLITATRAIAQGRELFALPGQVNNVNSEGPNELIQNGALVALSAKDIIDHYSFLYEDVMDLKAYEVATSFSDLKIESLNKYGVATSSLAPRQYVGTPEPYKRRGPETWNEPCSNGIRLKGDAFENQGGGASKKDTTSAERKAYESDESKRAYESLDADTRRVFDLLPDISFTPDKIAAHGIDIGKVIIALTMLELAGLVSSLPGGMYMKK